MNDSMLQTFENPVIGTLRGFIDEKTGEPWFLAGQVCRCLGIKNSADAVKQLKQRFQIVEEFYKKKGIASNYTLGVTKNIKLATTGGVQTVSIINEQALYELVFTSRKQSAVVFRAWVTGEVLPSLRKHGEYRMQGKLIRRTLTDTIKTEVVPKIESEKGKQFAYSNYSKMINKSLGLPDKVNRNTLENEMLEKIAMKENLVSAMIQNGNSYQQIKSFIFGGDI